MNKATVAVGLTLLLVPLAEAAPSKPSPITVPAARSASAAAVQSYLAARTAGQYEKAYALLSPATQGILPLDQFRAVKNFPKDPSADGMTPLFTALSAFFIDTHNTLGYRYFVLGALPNVPNTVLVRAQAPGADGVFVLKIVSAPDPVSDLPRLDLMQSAALTDPQGMLGAQQQAEAVTSLSNERQIGLGIIQYAQDNNYTLPDADRWVDEIMPYIKNEAVFHDPSAPAGQKWSYAYNRNLSGVKLAQLDDPASTVEVFESTSGTKNASDVGASVPVPGRHPGGTDYLFVDGHAKLLPDGTKVSYSLSGK